MAAPLRSTQQVSAAPGPAPITAEQRYWKTFKSQLQHPSPSGSAITHISHPLSLTAGGAATASDLFAVTSGGRIQLFSTRTRKPTKSIARFGLAESAHSGEIRADGRTLCAGGDSGSLQVFDVSSRAILKTWKEHTQAVHTARWNPADLTSLMSTSDDMSVRTWDLGGQDSVARCVGHTDYVRCGSWMPGQSAGLLVSGSYDQTVRIWDPRAAQKAVMTFKHAAAVEDVLPLPSGTSVLSAADNQVAVLDLVGAKVQRTLRAHQKTVTSMCLASNSTRLVSGSLDGHVKVFETTGWTLVAGAKYASPVLSVDVIPAPTSTPHAEREDRHLAVGLQSGVLSLKTRIVGKQRALQKRREAEMAALVAGTIASFDAKSAAQKKRKKRAADHAARLQGLDYNGFSAEHVLETHDTSRTKRVKIAQWDAALRRLDYGKALDIAIQGRNTDVVLTVLTALEQRSALRTALAGRNEVTLQPVLRWLAKHLADARHVELLSRASIVLLELYAHVLGQSAAVDEAVNALHERVRQYVDGAQVAWCTVGMMDTMMVGAG